MTTTDAEDWLARLFDNSENARQRLRCVPLPRMTLAAEDDVGWTQTSNAFERNVMEWLDQDFETGNQSAKNSPDFTRARSLAIDRVVYEIN